MAQSKRPVWVMPALSSKTTTSRLASHNVRAKFEDTTAKMQRMLRFLSKPQQSCLATVNQRCWLCEDATTWNKVIHAFGFEFWETRPGVLCFRAIPHTTDSDNYHDAKVAASIASKLLQLHACIDTVDIFYTDMSTVEGSPFWGFHDYRKKYLHPFPMRPNWGVRHLKARADPDRCVGLRDVIDLNNVGPLETLVLDSLGIGYTTALRIAAVVQRSAATLQEIAILNTKMSQESSDEICCKLQKCVQLRSVSLKYRVIYPESVDAVVELVSSSNTLEKVVFPRLATPEHVVQIAEAVATNTCLRDVHLCAPRVSLSPVFVALEANSAVQHLHLSGCEVHGTQAASLASMLCRNTGLRSLTFQGGKITAPAAKQLSDALRGNVTLEHLVLPSRNVDVAAINSLCQALEQNKVLKELRFGVFSASKKERAKLAALLTKTGGYGCVRLPLTDAYIPDVSSFLTQHPMQPIELTLRNICGMSTSLLKELCEALSQSTMVHSLKVHFAEHNFTNVDMFTEMLEANTSITSLALSLRSQSTYCLATKIASALVFNETVQQLTICDEGVIPCRQWALSFRRLLSWNETITKMAFSFADCIPPKLLRLLVAGVKRNKTILEFGAGYPQIGCTDNTYPLFEALRRNQSRLNRAVEFVRGDRDRQRAEAFEHLCGKRHLRSHMARATGWTDLEAQQRISASAHYLRSNFFVIAGVVQRSVQCHPVQGATQIDALNADCWLALARCLKLSDIVITPAP